MPEEGLHLWEWFWRLSDRRRSGPEAISFGEVGEWARLTGVDIQPDEVGALLAMDDAYLRAAREDQAAARERAQQTQPKGGNQWT
ncbi:phage tail assembly chaperone [Pseudoxanthomonas winnipegensis]|uniref:Uncharacterized protein n=1 Tax=Pseudoxanthomonas winnipegensis TaxID=2480810 RepID=A0A4V2HFD6_9GAMM|nr:hypothetical protein [Pseudoxanthomonas winnipegensis]RZZ90593.1 hypothetical protein EA663_02230 [Pseudoxanthomonas winnipegensis]TAA37251.1 hypothetical protein EA656_00810 [Pseudoxanthomonas winnipegensis]